MGAVAPWYHQPSAEPQKTPHRSADVHDATARPRTGGAGTADAHPRAPPAGGCDARDRAPARSPSGARQAGSDGAKRRRLDFIQPNSAIFLDQYSPDTHAFTNVSSTSCRQSSVGSYPSGRSDGRSSFSARFADMQESSDIDCPCPRNSLLTSTPRCAISRRYSLLVS
jgi:hypothetical protein